MILLSQNILKGSPALPAETVASLDDHTFLHGSPFATVILPEYVHIFCGGVSRIMSGIALGRTALTKLPDGTEVFASIFGYKDAEFITSEGQSTRIVIPNVAKPFLPMIEDPSKALHGYHSSLIQDTNAALITLESPYQLDPLPIDLL